MIGSDKMTMEMDVAIVGAGSWGTALALLMCGNGCHVRLWERQEDAVRDLQRDRENCRYLPGHLFPDNLQITSDLAEAVDGVYIVVIAVPSNAVDEVSRALSVCLNPNSVVLSASKGLECNTGRRMSEVISANIPNCANTIAALSGPNLAVELAAGVPTAGVVASNDPDIAQLCRLSLAGPTFRVYTSGDIVGVELGGALKNVHAIGAGICEGMGFGDNTKAALLTRGLAEMTRLAESVGARRETLSGLSGVGDLIATASSRLSRNLRVGLALGQGKTLEAALEEIKQVAEGVPTTRAAVTLAGITDVEMPIAQEIYGILFESRPPREGMANLMSRKWKDEPA